MPKKPQKQDNANESARLPLVPLRDTVVFPRMVLPIMIGREASILAVEEALESELPLLLCTQRDPDVERPRKSELYNIGVAASVLHVMRINDGITKVVVEGLGRAQVQRVYSSKPYLEAMAGHVDASPLPIDECRGAVQAVSKLFEQNSLLRQKLAPEVIELLRDVDDPDAFADMVCAHLDISVEERQELLATVDIVKRLELIIGALERDNELYSLEQEARDRVHEQMEHGQREYYLREQLKLIYRELGEGEDGQDEFESLRTLVDKARMPKEVRQRALREIKRYERMPAMSPESAITRNYIEWLVDMPWSKKSKDSLDLERAAKVLDEDHYGLDKVKERILEFLAVLKLSKSAKGPILCLVGAPGIGKTSLGRSIARAMNRKFARISLGGVHDEAEIRGHRRTYIGALPGRIIQGLKRCGVCNPVFMLDEVDKLGKDFRGDPASALLEVLDPEQNNAFSDHYLEVDYDLSQVFFITTANNEFDIPEVLLDRMELVQISGYTCYEKQQIAEQFLVPKQVELSGLKQDRIEFDSAAIDLIAQRYTREAGVRELERRIAGICRKVAHKVVTKRTNGKVVISSDQIAGLLGPPEYPEIRAETKPQVGLAVGLAWTTAGGDILNIETNIIKGKGELVLTGQLGDVMKESAQAAFGYLRAHAQELKIPVEFYKTRDVHVHVPEGAIPKDGPSAGLPIAISVLSALKKKAPQPLVAATGEITLLGRILAIGGLKEKVVGAHRAGIRTVIIPRENEKDLVKVPEEVKTDIQFILIETVNEAFQHIFPKGRTSPAAQKK